MFTTSRAPQPTVITGGYPNEIRRGLEVFCEPDDVYGFVALKQRDDRWESSFAGFFDSAHREDLIATAAKFSGLCESVCISVQPCTPAALALSANRVHKAGKGDSIAKSHIKRRARLFIDIDAIRAGGVSGISTTDEEKELAWPALEFISAFFPAASLHEIDSGNGFQLIGRLDEPADDAMDHMITRVLEGLRRATAEAGIPAEVDTSVASRNRLIRLPGTLNAKGDQIDGRVFRHSRIITEQPDPPLITHQQLVELADALAPENPPPNTNGTGQKRANDSETWLRDWLREHGVPVRNEHSWDGGPVIWETDCIHDSSHNGGEAYVGIRNDGKYMAGCLHAHCTWKWTEFRGHYQPQRKREGQPKKAAIADCR